MQEGDRVWTRREASTLRITRNRDDKLVVYGETVPIPRRTPGIVQGTVEAMREVVIGWYDQEEFDRVVEPLSSRPCSPDCHNPL
jgi:hypothetical protein